MGAMEFYQSATGKNAQEAFQNGVNVAAWENGHGGYSGTMAEKSEFVLIATVKTREEASTMAEKLMNDDDKRISDKWGAAGCIAIAGTNEYLFFGWASS